MGISINSLVSQVLNQVGGKGAARFDEVPQSGVKVLDTKAGEMTLGRDLFIRSDADGNAAVTRSELTRAARLFDRNRSGYLGGAELEAFKGTYDMQTRQRAEMAAIAQNALDQMEKSNNYDAVEIGQRALRAISAIKGPDIALDHLMGELQEVLYWGRTTSFAREDATDMLKQYL